MMSYDNWMRVASPWKVVEAAATDSTAREAAVSRIVDTMLELQLVCRHANPGYQPFSVTGNAPMPRSGRNVDQAMIAAEHYSPESEWHRACRWLLEQMPPRQAAAMLLQAARVRPDKMGESQWMVTASQMVECQASLLQLVGFRCAYLMPGEEEVEERHEGLTDEQIEALPQATAVRPFESVEALQKCARRARGKIREWLGERAEQAA